MQVKSLGADKPTKRKKRIFFLIELDGRTGAGGGGGGVYIIINHEGLS